MLLLYIRAFFRHLFRQKLFAAINLLGLALSMASLLVIFAYVRHEMSYDTFHPNQDRLYRINQTFIWGDDPNLQFSRTGPGVAHALLEEIPEVERTSSFHTPGGFIVSHTHPTKGEIVLEEDEVLAADSNFFRVFNFPLLKGQKEGAFTRVNTLMFTASTAQKYFGDEDPVGKMIELKGAGNPTPQAFEVIGVLQDVPDNSTIHFDMLISMRSTPVDKLHWSWIWTQLETFVVLREGVDLAAVEAKLKELPRLRAEETLQRAMNMSYADYIASGKRWDLFLQPISTLHLPVAPVAGSFTDVGNLLVIYAIIAAGIAILVLSCINFVNLSTAAFSRKVKAASIQKVLGRTRINLYVGQWAEALAFCVLAAFAAIALTELLLPLFRVLWERPMPFQLFSWPVLGLLATVVIGMSVASGIYPALILQKVPITQGIKGRISVGSSGARFRSGLVIFQFALSITMILSTAIVYRQLQFFLSKDMGFDKDNLMVLANLPPGMNHESLRDELAALPGVSTASWCNSAPPDVFAGDKFSAEGMGNTTFSLNYVTADENYIPALKLRLLAGRNFAPNQPADHRAVIVNAATLRNLGWPVDATVIGKKIFYPGFEDTSYNIVGVLSDFNYWSPTMPIEPMAIFHVRNPETNQGPKSFMTLRLEGGATAASDVAARAEQIWKQRHSDLPFKYTFVDDTFRESYTTYFRFGQVLLAVSIAALIVACLGLLGMITYAVEQRTKEIGIRKVSGANAWNIVSLLSGSYLRLVTWAFLIGAPISWLLMKTWLGTFAFRIDLPIGLYILTAGATLMVTVMVTGYQTLRAAWTNPVDVLKDE